MPFFDKERLLFIHIPKTGGTSIEDYFSRKHNIVLNHHSVYHRYDPNRINHEFETSRNLWKTTLNAMIDTEQRKRATMKQTSNFMVHVNNHRRNGLKNIDWSNVKRELPDFKSFQKIRLVRDVRHSLHHFTWSELYQHRDVIWPSDSIVKKYMNNRNPDNNILRVIAIVRNPYDRVISDLYFHGFLSHNIYPTKGHVYRQLKLYLDSNSDFDNHKTPQYRFLLDEHGKLLENVHIMKTETLTSDMHEYGYIDFNLHSNTTNVRLNASSTKYASILNRKSINLINEFYKEDFEHFDYSYLNILMSKDENQEVQETEPEEIKEEEEVQAEIKEEEEVQAEIKEEEEVQAEIKEEEVVQAEIKEEEVVQAEIKEEEVVQAEIKEEEVQVEIKETEEVQVEIKEEEEVQVEIKEEEEVQAEEIKEAEEGGDLQIIPEKNTVKPVMISAVTFGHTVPNINSNEDLLRAFASMYTGIPINRLPENPTLNLPKS